MQKPQPAKHSDEEHVAEATWPSGREGGDS